MLNVEAKTIKTIDADELLALLKEVYGFDDYNIAYVEEIGYAYGAYYAFSVDPDDMKYDFDEITECTSLQTIFIDLVKKGHLGLGTYYIWIEY